MDIGSKRYQGGAEKWTVLQIKRCFNIARQHGCKSGVALWLGQIRQINQRHAGCKTTRWPDEQCLAVPGKKHAQGLVPIAQLDKRAAQGRDIKGSRKAQRPRLVVSTIGLSPPLRCSKDLTLRFGGRRRLIEDRPRKRIELNRHDVCSIFTYLPGLSGLGTYQAGCPASSRPKRAPGTGGALASSTTDWLANGLSP